jgi:hypothetical protein
LVEIEFDDNIEGEGDQHAAAILRIMQLLHAKGARVQKDKQWYVGEERVKEYYPDVSAYWSDIVVEINGPVGHSSKRSHENELNQKNWFKKQGIKFFTYSPTEIAGRGWIDSKGKRHKPHTDEELYQDWGLTN